MPLSLIAVLFCLVFRERVLLWSHRQPGTCYVDQDGFKLAITFLPLQSEPGITSMGHLLPEWQSVIRVALHGLLHPHINWQRLLRLVGTRAYCREKTVALLLQIVKEPGFCPWPFRKLILTIAIKLYMYDSQIHFFHLNLFWAFMSVFLHTGHHHPDMTETLWTHISMMKPVFPLALPWRPTSITESPFTSLFKVSPQLFPILIQLVTA